MTGTALNIACIGEAMVELSKADPASGTVRMGFAGDTLNTAIYLARTLPGAQVHYVTRLGTDGFSDAMLATMQAEGIKTGLIGRDSDRLPGIYAIETDADGERSFRYWRDSSAARGLFSNGPPEVAALDEMDVLYLSGITLAILPSAAQEALIAAMTQARAAGRVVAFDSNYRPRLWPDAETARRVLDAAWRATTHALPSFDDEAALRPGLTPRDALARLEALGVPEIALKNGPAGPMLRAEGKTVATGPFQPAPKVVDTTAAGDSFNAGYLAARLQGHSMAAAAEAGHSLACQVIGAPGAILPR